VTYPLFDESTFAVLLSLEIFAICVPIFETGRNAPFTSTSTEDTVVSVTDVYKILDLIGKSEEPFSPALLHPYSNHFCREREQKIRLKSFNYHRDPLTPTYTRGGQTITSTPAMQLVKNRQN
jgi:hypothetical protein